MRAGLIIVIGCLTMLISSYSFSGCGGGPSGCGSSDEGYCSDSEYNSVCQCTDPSCNNSYGRDCLSKGECCEAFGNVGAR